MSQARDLWKRFAQHIGIPIEKIDASFYVLEEKYAAPERYYHTLHGHIRHCIELFYSVRHLALEPLAVEAALWTHDAHYDSQANDNEKQSSLWMRSFFEQFGVNEKSIIDPADHLIAATSHEKEPSEHDEKLIVDIDLAILGAAQKDFDQYEIGIRNEYAWVPWPLFAEKRAEILKKFLARPSIYHHQAFIEKYESQARKNLSRSILNLDVE